MTTLSQPRFLAQPFDPSDERLSRLFDEPVFFAVNRRLGDPALAPYGPLNALKRMTPDEYATMLGRQARFAQEADDPGRDLEPDFDASFDAVKYLARRFDQLPETIRPKAASGGYDHARNVENLAEMVLTDIRAEEAAAQMTTDEQREAAALARSGPPVQLPADPELRQAVLDALNAMRGPGVAADPADAIDADREAAEAVGAILQAAAGSETPAEDVRRVAQAAVRDGVDQEFAVKMIGREPRLLMGTVADVQRQQFYEAMRAGATLEELAELPLSDDQSEAIVGVFDPNPILDEIERYSRARVAANDPINVRIREAKSRLMTSMERQAAQPSADRGAGAEAGVRLQRGLAAVRRTAFASLVMPIAKLQRVMTGQPWNPEIEAALLEEAAALNERLEELPPTQYQNIVAQGIFAGIESAPQFATQIAAGALPGGALMRVAAFTSTGVAPVFGQTLQEAYAETGNLDRATDEAAIAATITAATNVVPGYAIVGRSAQRAIATSVLNRGLVGAASRTIAGGGAESVQEMTEQIGQEVLAHYYRGKEIDWRQIPVAGIAGMFLGGAGRGAMEIRFRGAIADAEARQAFERSIEGKTPFERMRLRMSFVTQGAGSTTAEAMLDREVLLAKLGEQGISEEAFAGLTTEQQVEVLERAFKEIADEELGRIELSRETAADVEREKAAQAAAAKPGAAEPTTETPGAPDATQASQEGDQGVPVSPVQPVSGAPPAVAGAADVPGVPSDQPAGVPEADAGGTPAAEGARAEGVARGTPPEVQELPPPVNKYEEQADRETSPRTAAFKRDALAKNVGQEAADQFWRRFEARRQLEIARRTTQVEPSRQNLDRLKELRAQGMTFNEAKAALQQEQSPEAQVARLVSELGLSPTEARRRVERPDEPPDEFAERANARGLSEGAYAFVPGSPTVARPVRSGSGWAVMEGLDGFPDARENGEPLSWAEAVAEADRRNLEVNGLPVDTDMTALVDRARGVATKPEPISPAPPPEVAVTAPTLTVSPIRAAFAALGPGHAKVAEALDVLVAEGTMRPASADLVMVALQGTSDEFLATIDIASTDELRYVPKPRRAADPKKPFEPWEMTADEWLAATRFYRSGKSKNAQVPGGQRVILGDESTQGNFREKSRAFLMDVRKRAIAKAITAGKPVPAEVLADYPDLIPKATAARVGGTTLIDKKRVQIAIARGLAQRVPEAGPADIQDASVLLEEYFHAAEQLLLSPEERAFLQGEYAKRSPAEWTEFFRDGIAGGDKAAAEYAGGTFEEWIAHLGVEHALGRRLPVSPEAQGIIARLVKALRDAIARLRGRMALPGTIEILDRMLAGRSLAVSPTKASDLASHFETLLRGGQRFATIVEARQAAGEYIGRRLDPSENKDIDEAMEIAVVRIAREIAQGQGTPQEKFDRMLVLMEQQPTLSTRTSTSVANQAYSTPAPLAYLASNLAGIQPHLLVFEPTAGNGMLLIGASTEGAIANELEQRRFDSLQREGFRPTQHDATDPTLAQSVIDMGGADVVIANPPFGTVRNDRGETQKFDLGRFETKQIDQAIAMRSLDAMKPDGRAVLILGAKGNIASPKEARQAAYRSGSNREFFYFLYERYRVINHFTVDGDLYRKQGAGFPVDVIVIEGKGKAPRALPVLDPPQVYRSWDELKGLLREEPTSTRPADVSAAESGQPGPRSDRGAAGQPAGDQPAGLSRQPGDESARTGGPVAGAGGVEPRVSDTQPAPAVGDGDRGDGSGELGAGSLGARGAERVSGEGAKPSQPRPGGIVQRADVGERPAGAPDAKRKVVAETEFQVAYEPGSRSLESLGTLVPRNMQTSISDALQAIEQETGGTIEQFVASELGYNPADLGKYFAAEQVDALAMAIANVKRGDGFIIGDQTGVGKGRFVAGMMHYAKRRGLIPVFVTEKPNLYRDIIRDLIDIGQSTPERPYNLLPTNVMRGKERIQLEDGRMLESPAASAIEDAFFQAIQNFRAGRGLTAKIGNKSFRWDAIVTTYSQMQTVGGGETWRNATLLNAAPSAMFIFDESHNGGGQEGAAGKGGRGEYARNIVSNASGTVFSSATYAKRPSAMDLYRSTDMRYAVDDPSELGEAIRRGGVPMQTVVANMLAEAKQYIRREQSYQGIRFDKAVVPIDQSIADRAAAIFREIDAFDDIKIISMRTIKRALDAQGAKTATDTSTGKGGVSSTNFTSLMHNIVDQMLFTLKLDQAAAKVVESLKAGERPVVALSNTMESLLSRHMDEEGAAVGKPANVSFADVVRHYLERSREVIIKRPGAKAGEGERVRLSDAQLGTLGVAQYNKVAELIDSAGFENLPASPIDYLIHKIETAGFKVAEITGREVGLDYSTPVPTYSRRAATTRSPAGRTKVIEDFQNGKVDVVIINQAGSTGLSLHADMKRAKDVRKRHMFILQADRNIDTFMQTLGRINRTGQNPDALPEYTLLLTDLPIELRPASVLTKKLASLNANVTADAKGAVGFDVPDVMNIVGDEAAWNIANGDLDLMKQLSLLKPDDKGRLQIDLPGADMDRQGSVISKLTGRVALLPPVEQKHLWELIEDQFSAVLEEKRAAGENPLEAEKMDLKAETLSRTEVRPQQEVGKATPFAAPVYIERVMVDAPPVSMTTQEALAAIAKSAGVSSDSSVDDILDAGKYAMGKLVEDAMADAAEYYTMAKRRGLGDDELASINETRNNFVQMMRVTLGAIGRSFQLTIGSDVVPAVLVRVHRTGKTKNPVALSSWTLDFATPSPWSRSLNIPASRFMGETPIEIRTVRDLLPEFDKMQKNVRRERYIATGNLLAAAEQFADVTKQIVHYTKLDGSMGQGMLMSRSFEFADWVDRRPVVFTKAENVVAFMEQGHIAWSKDSALSVRLEGGQVILSAPKAKSSGGRYYLNRGVLGAADAEFVSRGDRMVLTADRDRASAILEAYKAAGVVFKPTGGDSKARDAAAIIEGIKSADEMEAEIERRSDDETGPLFGRALESINQDELGFYSRIEDFIAAKVRGPQSASAILAAMRNAGLSPDEMKWTGIEEWLQGKGDAKVSPDELRQWMAQNRVQLKEVVKGETGASGRMAEAVARFDEIGQRVADELARQGLNDVSAQLRFEDEVLRVASDITYDPDVAFENVFLNKDERAAAEAEPLRVLFDEMIEAARDRTIASREQRGGETQYEQFTLPGGENYREVLLTLPPATTWTVKNVKTLGTWGDFRTRAEAVVAIAQRDNPADYEPTQTGAGGDFRSSHFPEPNIIAHLRMKDRVTPDGKRVLFLEEIQSDWHQQGREKGYRPEKMPTFTVEQVVLDEDLDPEVARIAESWGHPTKAGETVWAVKNEDGQIVATNATRRGAEENARARSAPSGVPDAPWSKTWHEMAFRRALRLAAEGGYDAIGWTTGDQQNKRYPGRPEKEEAGMREFYDRILPSYANKIGKRWGAAPETMTVAVEFTLGTAADPEGGFNAEQYKTAEVHAIPITKQMHESVVQQGQQMFGRALPTDTPEFKRWFGKSKVVNENGEPLVVYHSTQAPIDFTKFKRRMNDIGIHFGTLGQAEDRRAYISRIRETDQLQRNPRLHGGDRLIPAYLRIENPLRTDDAGAWDAENLSYVLQRAGISKEAIAREERHARTANALVAGLRNMLERMGYDGIVYRNTGETSGGIILQEAQDKARKELTTSQRRRGKPVNSFDAVDRETPEYKAYDAAYEAQRSFREQNAEDSYIVFRPTQIKSTFNVGTFDPNNPDIRFGRSLDPFAAPPQGPPARPAVGEEPPPPERPRIKINPDDYRVARRHEITPQTTVGRKTQAPLIRTQMAVGKVVENFIDHRPIPSTTLAFSPNAAITAVANILDHIGILRGVSTGGVYSGSRAVTEMAYLRQWNARSQEIRDRLDGRITAAIGQSASTRGILETLGWQGMRQSARRVRQYTGIPWQRMRRAERETKQLERRRAELTRIDKENRTPKQQAELDELPFKIDQQRALLASLAEQFDRELTASLPEGMTGDEVRKGVEQAFAAFSQEAEQLAKRELAQSEAAPLIRRYLGDAADYAVVSLNADYIEGAAGLDRIMRMLYGVTEEQAASNAPFKPGQWVMAMDRRNYGQVVQINVGEQTAQVRWINKRKGTSAQRWMPWAELTPAHPGESRPLAPGPGGAVEMKDSAYWRQRGVDRPPLNPDDPRDLQEIVRQINADRIAFKVDPETPFVNDVLTDPAVRFDDLETRSYIAGQRRRAIDDFFLDTAKRELGLWDTPIDTWEALLRTIELAGEEAGLDPSDARHRAINAAGVQTLRNMIDFILERQQTAAQDHAVVGSIIGGVVEGVKNYTVARSLRTAWLSVGTESARLVARHVSRAGIRNTVIDFTRALYGQLREMTPIGRRRFRDFWDGFLSTAGVSHTTRARELAGFDPVTRRRLQREDDMRATMTLTGWMLGGLPLAMTREAASLITTGRFAGGRRRVPALRHFTLEEGSLAERRASLAMTNAHFMRMLPWLAQIDRMLIDGTAKTPGEAIKTLRPSVHIDAHDYVEIKARISSPHLARLAERQARREGIGRIMGMDYFDGHAPETMAYKGYLDFVGRYINSATPTPTTRPVTMQEDRGAAMLARFLLMFRSWAMADATQAGRMALTQSQGRNFAVFTAQLGASLAIKFARTMLYFGFGALAWQKWEELWDDEEIVQTLTDIIAYANLWGPSEAIMQPIITAISGEDWRREQLARGNIHPAAGAIEDASRAALYTVPKLWKADDDLKPADVRRLRRVTILPEAFPFMLWRTDFERGETTRRPEPASMAR